MPSTRDRLERHFAHSPKGRTDRPPRRRAVLQTEPSAPSPLPGSDAGTDQLYRLERELLGDDAGGEALSVKERLERLIGAASQRPRRRLDTDRPRRHVSLDEVLEGQRIDNGSGSFYCTEYKYPLDHRHGRLSLSRLRAVSPSAFSVLARADEGLELDLGRALFLDTETTGLAGGSGTCAFLIGLGFLEEDGFVVRQLFMRDYPEEPAMLDELARLLPRFDSLVTYNGKSYDIPLLESRLILSRRRLPIGELPHFDLLHPARSLWKARLESCRLTDLEYVLLNLERDEDVPSELIPGLYFDYVRSGNAAKLFRVFNHNRYDILSLAALTVRASEMLDEDAAPEHPLDDYSLGRLFERAAQPERSMLHYARAIETGLTGPARRRSLWQLSAQMKRQGRWEESLAIWRQLADGGGPEAIEALEELAMYHEHREGDFGAALQRCAEATERIADDFRLPLSRRERWDAAFQRRRRRLERRLHQRPPGRRGRSQASDETG